jgi:hypothetical protein
VHFDFIPQKFGKTEKLYICTVDNENSVLMTTQAIQETIAEYFKTQPVLKAWLFGSYARGEQRGQGSVPLIIFDGAKS